MSDHAGHSHAPSTANKNKLWFILFLTAGYLVAEIIGGILSGSLALLADAGHMALDVAAVALGLFASWFAQKPPTLNRTYGYYRAEILAALVNGITLVVVSLWIFYEAWERFQSPPQVQGGVMAIVAAGGLLVNIIAMAIMHRDKDSGLNMQGVWLHLLTDAMGSVAAMLGAFFIWKFDWYLADPIISVIIGVLILVGAWKLLVECVDVLLVSVPKGTDTEAIKSAIESVPGVSESHDLHIWAMGSNVKALSVHVKLEKGADYVTTFEKLNSILESGHQIQHATLQLEPHSFTHHSHLCAPGKSFAHDNHGQSHDHDHDH